jgi:2,3-bisphosphoglycerate-independent phosphoglycerate mutase
MNAADKPCSAMGEAIRRAYRAGEEDEALTPIVKTDARGIPVGRIRPGEAVIFYDIRGEREVEITRSLVEPGFKHFPTAGPLGLRFVTMIEYDPALPVKIAFPKEGRIRDTLAEVAGRAGLRLLKIAESEKAAHIGFFLNGRSGEVFPGEERIVVPSPEGLVNYDQAPEMSAGRVAEEIVKAIIDSPFDLIIANFANVDVVGHTENREAVVAAVETVDRELGRVVAAARNFGVTLIVTADHGTVEEWLYPDGQVNTGHTQNPVPFILADFSARQTGPGSLRREGELADVAPTVLELLGLARPAAMTGQSLLEPGSEKRGKGTKTVLVILDGWGLRSEEYGNLIAAARTPHFDDLWAKFLCAEIQSSGEAVGMPPGTVGNSEAGHLHLGAGRRVLLDRVRIDAALADGSFFENRVFREAMAYSRERRSPLHLMGIISHYSSHGTIRHLFALLELGRREGLRNVFLHGFIGRRGEKPESGALYVENVEARCRELGLGEVVTVMGRTWSLDREENWDRIERAYRALVYGEGTLIPRELFESESV